MAGAKHYPASRYVEYSEYYAYGNTPAEDFLEHVHSNDASVPSILVLGCGDFRSCLYSLWKHFAPIRGKTKFKGVDFYLNDHNSAVLARNVLFLHTILINAHNDPREWIPSLWAVWYSCELLPTHDEALKKALVDLMLFSQSDETWNSSNEPICTMCRFDGNTMSKVRLVWKMWVEEFFGTPSSRLYEFRMSQRAGGYKPFRVPWTVEVMLGAGKDSYSAKVIETMVGEFNEYALNGSALAETVCFSLPYQRGEVMLNPTFFDRKNAYTLYGLVPYKCFHHSVQFSSKAMLQSGVSKDILCSLPMIVADEKFTTHPFLANSVQQFTFWMTSAAKILHTKSFQFRFVFHCSDCIQYCQELHTAGTSSFDAIYTSNVMDYLGPLVLVLSTISLLNEKGVLITTSLHYLNIASNTDEYLSLMFGFEIELLPALFGIRCTGHEGKYSNPISIHSTPYLPHFVAVSWGWTDRFPNIMIWESCKALPLKVLTLQECLPLVTALHNLTREAITSPFLKEMRSYSQFTMSSETVIRAYLSFVQNLHPDVPSKTYQFWDSLSTLLKADASLVPYLPHLQTLAFLHGLHLHLVCSVSDCPLCNEVPLAKVIKEISIQCEIPAILDKSTTTIFIGCVHKGSINCKTMCLLLEQSLCVIDGIACIKDKLSLKVSIFLPVTLCATENNISVVAYNIQSKLLSSIAAHFVCTTVPISHATSMPNHTFTFSQPKIHNGTKNSPFGMLQKHIGDRDQFVTDIVLNEQIASNLDSNKLCIDHEQPSKSSITLISSDKHFALQYPYAINFMKSKVQLSKRKGVVTIFAQRDTGLKGRPLFNVDSSNPFCFRQLTLSNETILNCGKAQLTPDEIPYSTNYTSIMYDVQLPVLGAKQLIISILSSRCKYCCLANRNDDTIYGLIAINERVYDVEKRSPAIDLHFYISSKGMHFDPSQPLWKGWLEIAENFLPKGLLVDFNITEGAAEVLEAAFMHFAACTLHRTYHKHLTRVKIEHHFTHAVVYPLYMDKDKCSSYYSKLVMDDHELLPSKPKQSIPSPTLEACTPFPTIHDKEKCYYCNSTEKKLLKCSRCNEVWYCSKKCQAEHWKIHKTVCKVVATNSSAAPSDFSQQPTPLTCSACNKESNELKKCLACHSVAYCNTACQKKDWPKHRAYCTKIKTSREV